MSGQGGSVGIGSAIARVKRWTMSPTGDSKDISNMASAGWKYTRTVMKSTNGECEVEAFPGDIVGSVLAATFITSSEIGSKTYAGSVTVTGAPVEVPYDDIVAWRLQFESYGPIAIT
jgi:hypothetical protein